RHARPADAAGQWSTPTGTTRNSTPRQPRTTTVDRSGRRTATIDQFSRSVDRRSAPSVGLVHTGSHRQGPLMAATPKTTAKTTSQSKSYDGFTAEERDAMKEHAKELKASRGKAADE